jgi:hypothetical protein
MKKGNMNNRWKKQTDVANPDEHEVIITEMMIMTL